MFRDYFNRKFKYYILSVEAGNLLELFWVFAIASLLLVRIFLELAGFPKLGGGGFHIAHMLWGGFLMMIAIFLLLAFLNKQAKQAAAIIGGVGFGMFIDELGKFITNDNNYFYQPTIALIYVIFVLLFFIMRAAEKQVDLSKTEYAVNAVEEIKELVVNHLDESEKTKITELLGQSDPENPVVKNLKDVLANIQSRTDLRPGIFASFKRLLNYIYVKVILTDTFSKILVTFFAMFALVSLVRSLADFQNGASLADLGEFVCAAVAAALVVRGVYHLHDNVRLEAYHSFKNAVLVSLFLTQFFLFIKDQLAAMLGLLISVASFIGIQYLISEEKLELKAASVEPPKK